MPDSNAALQAQQLVNQTDLGYGQIQASHEANASQTAGQLGEAVNAGQQHRKNMEVADFGMRQAMFRQKLEAEKMQLEQSEAADRMATEERRRAEITQRMAAAQQLQSLGLLNHQVEGAKLANESAKQQIEMQKKQMEQMADEDSGKINYRDYLKLTIGGLGEGQWLGDQRITGWDPATKRITTRAPTSQESRARLLGNRYGRTGGRDPRIAMLDSARRLYADIAKNKGQESPEAQQALESAQQIADDIKMSPSAYGDELAADSAEGPIPHEKFMEFAKTVELQPGQITPGMRLEIGDPKHRWQSYIIKAAEAQGIDYEVFYKEKMEEAWKIANDWVARGAPPAAAAERAILFVAHREAQPLINKTKAEQAAKKAAIDIRKNSPEAMGWLDSMPRNR